MTSMDAAGFEDRRWARGGYGRVFRHEAALDLIPSGALLDIGCGDGILLSLLSARGISGIGIDFSPEAVRHACGIGIDARLHDVASHPLPFGDSSFDCVVMLDVLEHLYDPLFLLHEARRVTRRYAVIGVPNFNSFVARCQSLFGTVPENNRSQKGHIYWFNLRVLIRMLSAAGFSVRSLRTNTVLERIPFVGSFMRFLCRIFPSFFALSFVVLAEKR